MTCKKRSFLQNATIYENIRLIYIIALLLYSVIRQNITALQPFLLSNLINVGMTAVAACIILWDILVFKNIFQTKNIWLLIVFVVFSGITILLNFRYELVDNIKALINLCIQFFLLYVTGNKKGRKRIDFELQAVGNSLSVVWGTAVAISVYMYFANIYYRQTRYLWGDAVEISQGFVHQHHGATVMRLWGVFVDPNFAAAISIAVLFISCYIITATKHKWCKVFHAINIVLQGLYIVLSNSRMALLVSYLMAFVGVWYIAWRIVAKWKTGVVVKECCCIVLAAAALFACMGIFQCVKAVLPKVQSQIVALENPSAPIETEPLDREDIAEKTDISNGRFALWKEGLSVFANKPVLGIASRSYHTVALQLNPAMAIAGGSSVHNSYLELLMGHGVLGFACLLWFFLLCAKDTLLIRYKKTGLFMKIAFVMLAVFSLLVSGFFISCLFFTLSGATVLLFILLGYAVQLMQLAQEEVADQKQALFICETPYHLFNCLRLADAVSAQQHGQADIYIHGQFPNADICVERLREAKCFDRVCLVKKHKTYTKISKLVTLFRICFPRYTLKQHLGKALIHTRYHTIYIGYFTPLSDCIRQLNPQANICLYEDGIGSYCSDNLEDSARSGLFKAMNRFVFNNRLSYHVQTLYLNHPECYKGTAIASVQAIPKNDQRQLLASVFDYAPNRQYQDHSVVYLTQPLAETAIGDSAATVENAILTAVQDRVLVRVHPRQDKKAYAGYTVDTQNNLWELECAEQITDDHVLIGAFSTAQFTPKMLYDKEPTVIFTYKLYGHGLDDAAQAIDMLRGMYQHPQKIIVAETIADLQKRLNDLGAN